MLEWIRFGLVAFFLILALIGFAMEVLGVIRFGFVMNRMHAAGIGDTWGVFFVALAIGIADGFTMTTLKLMLLVLFLWFASPTSTHFLSQIELGTDRHIDRYLRWLGSRKQEADS